MNKVYFVFIPILLFLAACTPSQVSSNPTDDQFPSPPQVSESDNPTAPIETSGPDCLGPEIHPIGQEISNQFEEASYEDVMTWFCNGAEFEDILIALQTEKDTGQPAEDLLKLLVEGQTWEEIWDAIGYTE
jgi:hypothetical protein